MANQYGAASDYGKARPRAAQKSAPGARRSYEARPATNAFASSSLETKATPGDRLRAPRLRNRAIFGSDLRPGTPSARETFQTVAGEISSTTCCILMKWNAAVSRLDRNHGGWEEGRVPRLPVRGCCFT